MSIKIYLCGAITGKTREHASSWRKEVMDELTPLGYILLDPLRVEMEHLLPKRKIGADDYGEDYKAPEMRPAALYARDMYDVAVCDILFANMNDCTKGSLGSSHEIGFADGLRKMIILVARPGNIYREHPITHNSAGVVFDEQPEAIDYIKRNYAPYVTPKKQPPSVLVAQEKPND